MAMTESAFRLRKNLDHPIPEPEWPVGFSCRSLRFEDAPDVHRLLASAYAGGPDVPDFEAWWGKLSGDYEFDASFCCLVFGEGRLAGAALCWTSAFPKDFVVHPDTRGLGLGENLLITIFRNFQAKGASAVDLKVEARNASAIRLYERVGMYRVPYGG
jgi:ribosomal protein S18 acetylase RimI-like enzyme